MNDIDIKSLEEDGYVEYDRLAGQYERKFSMISMAGFILIFSPAIGYYLNNDTLKNFYWFVTLPLGFLFLILSILLMHTGSPVSPATGKKMKRYRATYSVGTGYERYLEIYDVWVCHDSRTFCKRLFMTLGGDSS